MSKFLSQTYWGLVPYTPGEQPKSTDRIIKLNTNENPFDPSPMLMEAISTERIKKLRLYPEISAAELVNAISDEFDVSTDMVFVGNGSDEILAFCFMAFQNKKRKFIFPDITYGFYSVYADLFGACANVIPLDENLQINPKDYMAAEGTIVIANPNAPTGLALSKDTIEEIVVSNPDNLVIIDEAYVDFGAESVVFLTKKYNNLLVVRTFSKSRNLAGARIGFAIGDSEIIRDLMKIKFSFNPYNLSSLSILAGKTALEDKRYFDKCVSQIITTREWFVGELESLGYAVLPSKANFIFAKPPAGNAKEIFHSLRKQNIIIRHFDKPRISQYLRITIGTREDMQALLEALE